MNTSDSTIIIPLTKGQQTIIDAIDADLAQLKWHANYMPTGNGYYYARRGLFENAKQTGSSYLHHEILERIIGRTLKGNERCDHIDRNTLNNRRNNLRLATVSQNRMNSKTSKHNTSGRKGVYWHKRISKWEVRINIDKKEKHLGFFNDYEDAVKCRVEAEQKYYGEFSES